MRAIPQFMVSFVKAAEGCSLVPYQDSKGVWTIGYGHTGPEVARGLMWTQARADAQLIADLAKHAALLYDRVKTPIVDGWSDHQYGALVDFVFNLGAGDDWTIWKVLNRGVTGEAVTTQMKRFDKIVLKDGTVQVLPGLTNRRGAEVTLYNTPDDVHPAVAIAQAAPSAGMITPPSSQVRTSSTPPAAMPEKPLATSKSFIASCASAATVCATTALPAVTVAQHGVTQSLQALAPFTGGSTHVAAWVASLTTIAALLAVAVPVLIAMKNRETKG